MWVNKDSVMYLKRIIIYIIFVFISAGFIREHNLHLFYLQGIKM